MEETINFLSDLNLDEPNDERNFYICEFNNNNYPTNQYPMLHRHPFYEIMFIIKGEGIIKVDFKDYHIQKGALFLFSALQIHLPISHSITENFHGFLLRFDQSFFAEKEFFDNISIFNFDYLIINEPEYFQMKIWLYKLLEEYKSNKPLSDFTLKSFLNIFLISIQRLLPDVIRETKMTNIFGSLNKLIEQNHYKLASSSYYAKQLKIPLKLLNQTVRAYSGMPCGNYIRSKTLIEAKRLLLYTTLNVSEVANELGFMDMKYFSRFFKQHTGLPPVRFKKVIISKYNAE